MRDLLSLDGLVRAPRRFGRALITAYRLTLSPLIGFDCRHLPTCSAYADEALARFGLWAGGWMTLARLCRCHPLGTRGLDFIPDTLPARARWYMPWRYGRWRGTNTTAPARAPLGDCGGNDSEAADQRAPRASGSSRCTASADPSSTAR
jgi:hypothetical protein